jgi:predicted permease
VSWIHGLSQRIRSVVRFGRVESELDRELREHLAIEVERQLRSGASPDEAWRLARLRVGGLDALKEEVRDERGGRVVTDALSDFRIGWRGLRRNPGFTFAVVVSLALGAGATTAIFTVVYAVLMQPLPYPGAGRLHTIRVVWNEFDATLSAADFLRLREEGSGVAEVGAFWIPSQGYTMLTGSGPEVVRGATISSDLLRVLGVSPLVGRWLASGTELREALISTELWRQRFGGTTDVVGKSLTLDAIAYTVVGVMPPGFDVPGQSRGAVWVGASVNEPTRRGPFVLTVVARLRPGVSAEQAAVRLTSALLPVLRDRYRADVKWRYRVRSLKDGLVGDVRATLLLLFGAVTLVFAIAIANVANLTLARGATRARELAIRASLGAARGRLVRQLLAESTLLGLLGGGIGLALAGLILAVTTPMATELVPRLPEVQIDAVVVVFALAAGAIAGVLAGIVPALGPDWRRMEETLRDGGRGAGESVRQGHARRLFVATEVALTLSVLVGAALLVKSLIRLQTVDPGFRPDGVLSFRVALPGDPYRDNARLDAFLSTLEARLRGLPGVSAVGLATSLPPDRGQWANNYTIEGSQPAGRGATGVAKWINASPEYFAALGIPVTRGRVFTSGDRADAMPVAVVSESLVRQHFPGGDVLGKRFKGGDWSPRGAWITIVGVVGDVPYERGMLGGLSPAIYLAHSQNLGVRSPFVVVRASGDPTALAGAARRAVLDIDPQVPLRDVASMAERLRESAAAPRFRTLLFSWLAGIALIVSVTGIYGLLAYHVSQRRRETAIRRAFGAPSAQIVAAVVGAGLRLTLAGVAIGLVGAFALTRSLSGLLYEVAPRDPGVFAFAAGTLVAAALAACIVPSIRAMRVDPISLLREE